MKKWNKIFCFIASLILGLFIMGSIRGQAQELVTLTGDNLKNKLVYTKGTLDADPSQGQQPPHKVLDYEPLFMPNYGYIYELTKAIQSDGGSVYLEDRLDLKYDFEMKGYVNFSMGNRETVFIADGIGIVFHTDDNNFSGYSGHTLGIGGLTNARGLAIDIFRNTTDKFHPEILPDPSDMLYSQIWSTDARGYLKREDTHKKIVDENFLSRSPSTMNDATYMHPITMKYNHDDRMLTFTLSFRSPNVTRTHTIEMPKEQKYAYFSANASTGMYYAIQRVAVQEIKYMPFRSRKIIYQDENMNVINVPNNDEITGAVNTSFDLNLNHQYLDDNGYDVVNIQGDMSGSFSLTEKTEERFVYVNVRKKRANGFYESKLKDNDILRNDTETSQTLEIKPENNGTILSKVSGFTDSKQRHELIKSIEVSSPKGVSISKDPFPSGVDSAKWHKVVQNTKTETITQYIVDDVNGYGLSSAAMTADNASQFLKTMSFNIPDTLKNKLLDEKKIIYDVRTRPVAKYREDIGNTYYEVINNFIVPDNFGNDTAMKVLSNKEAIKRSQSFIYQGLTGQIASSQTGTKSTFINSLVTAGNEDAVAWINNNQSVPSGVTIDPLNVKRFVVEYHEISNVQTNRVPDLSGNKEASIPQPVYGQLINQKNAAISDKLHRFISTPYRIGHNAVNSNSQVPTIENYEFLKFEDGYDFPIKVTDKWQEIKLIYKGNNPTMTLKYLQLDRKTNPTTLPVYKNLKEKIIQDPISKEIAVDELIEANNSAPDFVGYTFVKEKTKIMINSNNNIVTDGKAPNEDFTVYYYYQPKESISVPAKLSFGEELNDNKFETTYGVDEENTSFIQVINTYEENGWDLVASTEGMTSTSNGRQLPASIFYREKGKEKIISKDSQPIIDKKNDVIATLPLSSADEKDGLFVKVGAEAKDRKYSGNIKFALKVGP